MSDAGDRKRVIGTVLIPEARLGQKVLIPEGDSVPIALELFYTALAMKASAQHPALFIARRFAERMGLDVRQVEEFAMFRLEQELEAGESDA